MLYIVATPIGHMGDITLRAIETLRQVDLVASEDTRKTGRLLKHHGIQKPQIPYHEHNEARAVERILERLRSGESVAIVTNAGTPGISDPGFSLIRRALDEDYSVTVIPGPTALVAALVLSGLPAHSFLFRGFPPRKQSARKRFFAADSDQPYTLIYYESPHRIVASLEDALQVLGDRQSALANDLTKWYESVSRGKLSELLDELRGGRVLGEYVLVVAGAREG